METKTIGILSLTAVMLVAVMTVPAMAYNIDGDLDDWGLDELKTIGNWNDPGAWVPNSPAYYKVEDNQDPRYSSYTGIHIQGPPQSDYDEPEIQNENLEWVPQPYGGERFDIEAMYFDRDVSAGGDIYVAIIASSDYYNPLSGIADLRILLGGVEYGIVLSDHNGLNSGEVYKNPAWIPTPDRGWIICPHDYYRIDANSPGTPMGSGTVNTGSLPNDHSKSNYVVEISAPKTAFEDPDSGDLHLITWCANDRIDLEEVPFGEIPEFATIAIPAGIIFGLFYFYRRKRQSKEE